MCVVCARAYHLTESHFAEHQMAGLLQLDRHPCLPSEVTDRGTVSAAADHIATLSQHQKRRLRMAHPMANYYRLLPTMANYELTTQVRGSMTLTMVRSICYPMAKTMAIPPSESESRL